MASWQNESKTLTNDDWSRRNDLPRPNVSSRQSRLELAKRLKPIFEDENIDFGTDDPDERTLCTKFDVATRLCKDRIDKAFRNIRTARDVQLCFLVDCTCSMRPHIEGVRQSILDIVKRLTGEVAQSLEVAFVAYRDIGDSNRFEVHGFSDADKFKSFCNGISPSGGHAGTRYDLCEDVFGGLDTALDLNWSGNCGTKVIFHICDNPCHGKEFHDAVDDGQPDGDPEGRNPEDLFGRMRRKEIQYYFGKITRNTDIMIEKFSAAYGEPITVFDVKDVAKIKDSVICAVTQSVHVAGRAMGDARRKRTFTIDKTEPHWSSLKEMKGTFVTYECPRSINDIKNDVPLERRKSSGASVRVSKNPFATGAERLAYYGKDLSTSEDVVLKEYLHTGKGMNTEARYEMANQVQTIASFFAQEFIKDLKTRGAVNKTISFLAMRTLVIENESPSRFMSCEKRITTFIRFTNNADFHLTDTSAKESGVNMEFVQLVTAFSHWTYKASNRFLMVVDLEGVIDGNGVLLTDPAIHCQDNTRYGRMNLGEDGMKKFFYGHTCNQFCNKLGLNGFMC